MYYPCKLVLSNYRPLTLEKGMLFYSREENKIKELNKVPLDTEKYILTNGYPVELNIKRLEGILATNAGLNWWIEEEEGLRKITIDDINYLLSEEENFLNIDLDDYYLSMGVSCPNEIEGEIVLSVII